MVSDSATQIASQQSIKKYVDDNVTANALTAAAVITDHAIARGAGGARAMQDSGLIIDDSDNLSGVATLTATLLNSPAWNNSGAGVLISNDTLTINGGNLSISFGNSITVGSLFVTDTAGSLAMTNVDSIDATTGAAIEADVDHDNLVGFEIGEHFTEASIDHDNITNNGANTHARLDSHMDAYNGSLIEPFTFVVTSNGSTITGTLDKNPTGDLTERFSDGYTTVSSGTTVTLTAGSDTSPAKNYVYILQSNKGVLVVSTSSFPTAQHIAIAEVIVQSATKVQTDGGGLVNRFWNDYAKDTTGQGHHLHSWERMRFEHSKWSSGGAITWTITTNAGSADEVDLAVTAAKIYQMHLQDFGAENTGTGDNIHVVNDSSTPYTEISDFADLLTDNTGASMSGKYFNLVVWGSVSSGSEIEHIFVNLPGGSYNRQADAIADTSGFTVYDIPSDFRGKAFLITKITLRHQVAANGTWTSIEETDLRGQVPNIVAGGGTAAITTEFADNQFKLFDEGDPSKEAAFQLSGISASTTRTFTFPDANGTIVIAGSASHDGFSDFVANEHLLVGAIDHDSLLNFASNEHFTQAGITVVGTITTGVWNAGAVTSSGALTDGAASSLTTATTIGTTEVYSGGLVIVEAADHPIAAAATKGQIWVSNDATQKLMFTDDAGADTDLTAGGSLTQHNHNLDTDAAGGKLTAAVADTIFTTTQGIKQISSNPPSISGTIIGIYNDSGIMREIISVGGAGIKIIPGELIGIILGTGQDGRFDPNASTGAPFYDVSGLLHGITLAGTESRALDADGVYTNFVTAGSTGNDAGFRTDSDIIHVSGSYLQWFRVGIALPSLTAIRMFCGFTDQTLATMVGSDSPAGKYCGFQFSSVRGDSNWRLVSRGTGGMLNTDTGMTATTAGTWMMAGFGSLITGKVGLAGLMTAGGKGGDTVFDLDLGGENPAANDTLKFMCGIEQTDTTAKNIRIHQAVVVGNQI